MKDMAVLPRNNKKQFSLAATFHPRVLEAGVVNGVFPMTTTIWEEHFPAFKLHRNRCVFDYSIGELPHIRKKTSKKANQMEFVLNGKGSFNRAIEMIDLEQSAIHGRSWLCPQLGRALSFIMARQDDFSLMRIMVWEVFVKDQLAAVEIGYCVGKSYTSMTGAFDRQFPSAGSVQLAVTGVFLAKHGFEIWDFGMEMAYKTEMGAGEISRVEWIDKIAKCAKYCPRIVCEGTRYHCGSYLKTEEHFLNEID
jgi:Leu/Phe-tRNA-protein transferase